MKVFRYQALKSIFGNVVEKEYDRPEFLTAVQKFSVQFTNMNSFGMFRDEVQPENKEIFDGSRYQNKPEGDIETLTEGMSTDDKPDVKKAHWGSLHKIAKMDAKKRIVLGAVYVPYDPNDLSTIDTHGHAATAEEIEKAAYEFMRQMNLQNIDRQHNFKGRYGYVVESYLAKAGDPLFKEGTWVMGTKVTCDKTWEMIEKGEITGFSLAGEAELVPFEGGL